MGLNERDAVGEDHVVVLAGVEVRVAVGVDLHHGVVHYDDERNCLALCEQVVHDEVDLSEMYPDGLVLAAAVLQVEYGILGVKIVPVFGRRVDIAALPLACHCGEEVLLGYSSVGNVLDEEEFLIHVGDLDVVDGIAPAIADGRQGVDDSHAVHVEDQLLLAGLIVLDGAGPHSVFLKLEVHHVLRIAGCDLFRCRSIQGDPDLSVRIYLVADVGVAVLAAVDHVGDELTVEAQGTRVKYLVVEEILRNIHYLSFPRDPVYSICR